MAPPAELREKHAIELRPRPKFGLGVDLIGPEEEALVLEVLRRKELFRYYGADPERPPPMVARLEQEFKAYLGISYALAVTSGTSALEVALAAAGIGPGDEVIVNAYSWISCLSAIVRVGARPVLAEIDASLNLAQGEISRLATPRTRAVLVVHYQGVAADMASIQEEATGCGLLLIEDCAQSLGVSYHGRKVGTLGGLATFSFQHNKIAAAGEGGMVVTNDARYYERAVRFHDLGQYRSYHTRIAPSRSEAFLSGQCRMSELTAAVALAQLRKVDGMRDHCRRLQARILPRLATLPGLALRPVPDPTGDFGYEIYLCLADARHVPAFRSGLDRLNVNCGQRTGTAPQYTYPQVQSGHTHALGASSLRTGPTWPAPGYRAEDFPRTENLIRRLVALPIGVLYTDADADYIADCVIRVHHEVVES